MKRDVIKIDQNLCNGCGQCVNGCPEGAIKMVDGKAKLVSETYCDGLGACIGDCPVGAITIEKREVAAYDETKVMENIIAQGDDSIKAHLKHLKEHNQITYFTTALKVLREKGVKFDATWYESKKGAAPHVHGSGGCPGSREMKLTPKPKIANYAESASSELSHWPIQLHLVSPQASFFDNADILVAADCVAFSFPNFHSKFLKGKKLLIFCPKLDHSNMEYVEKLTEIVKTHNIKSFTVLHMEVPCCFGTLSIVEGAINRSGKNVRIEEVTISVGGEIVKNQSY